MQLLKQSIITGKTVHVLSTNQKFTSIQQTGNQISFLLVLSLQVIPGATVTGTTAGTTSSNTGNTEQQYEIKSKTVLVRKPDGTIVKKVIQEKVPIVGTGSSSISSSSSSTSAKSSEQASSSSNTGEKSTEAENKSDYFVWKRLD